MLAIFKRELRSYFVSPTGYVFLGLFLLLSGIFFAFGTILSGNSRFPDFLRSIQFVFLLAVPVLTMRLMSEETRQKTDQLLFTSPIPLREVLLGKFFAALTIFAIALAVCLCYSVVILAYGDLNAMETLSAALGFLLLGASFIAVGTFISCVTENQAVAAVGTFATLLIFWILEPIKAGLPQDVTAGIIFAAGLAILGVYALYASTKSILYAVIAAAALALAIALCAILKSAFFYGFIASALEWFSLLKRQESFSMGLIKLDNVVYYLSFIFAFLFLGTRFIEKRRWI
jgi:ABC-2 type transport system permease protein